MPGQGSGRNRGSNCLLVNCDDIATVAYDVSTGGADWAAQFDYTGGFDSPSGIVESPDGSALYVAGTRGDTTGQNVWAILKYT